MIAYGQGGTRVSRRGVLAGSVAAAVGARTRPVRAQAKPDKLVYVGDNGPWHWCLVQEVAPAFEKATGIKVDFTLLPGDAQVVRLKSELSAGSGGIDIVQWNPNMAGWVTRHMQDHQKLLDAAASRHPDFDWADFLPAVQAMATYDGKLAGIPCRVVADILHYQKPVLEQAGIARPPESFAELLAAAEATTKQGLPHRYGVGFIARQGPAILDPFTPLLRSAGGRFYDPKTGEIFINQPPAIEVLQFYGELMTKYHVMNPDSLTWEFDGIIGGAQNDQIAMTITMSPYGELMNQPGQSKTAGNWAWAMVPGKDSIAQSRTHLGGWALGVPEGCKHTEWAFEFIQLATSKQWLRRSIDLANSPPRLSVLQDPAVLAKHPWAPVQGESLKTATLDPQDAMWSTLQLPLRVAVSQVLLGQKNAGQALDDVARQWQRSFRLAGLKG